MITTPSRPICAGMLDQLPGVDVAIGGMLGGVQVMVESHEVGQLGAEGDGSRRNNRRGPGLLRLVGDHVERGPRVIDLQIT